MNKQMKKTRGVKHFNRSVLSIALTTALCQLPTLANAAYDNSGTAIGDLEIYQASQGSGANIMMMLDVSGSMGVISSFHEESGLTLVGADSIYDDFTFSCVFNKEDPKQNGTFYNPNTGQYVFAPLWENNNGLGVLETRSVQIGSLPAITHTITGCQPGSWNVTPAQDITECKIPGTFELQTERYVGLDSNNRYAYKYVNATYIEDPNGRYAYLRNAYGSRDIWDLVETRYPVPSSVQRYSRGVYDGTECTVTGTTSYQTNGYDVDPRSTWQWTNGDIGNHVSRLERLKIAMIAALTEKYDDDYVDDSGDSSLAGQYKISSNNLIGLGIYSAYDLAGDQATNADKRKGVILAPAAKLTEEHRHRLVREIIALTANAATPSANAYAEAGAYLKQKNGTAYTGTLSGYSYAASDAVRNGNYYNPGSESAYQCYGKGIYFLTDGTPNRQHFQTDDYMLSILDENEQAVFNATAGLSEVDVEYDTGSGWLEIGKFANALRNRSDNFEDIKTATVGFGATFGALENTNALTITNAKGENIEIIDCEATTDVNGDEIDVSQDAENLCNWGRKENYTLANGELTVSDDDKKYGGGGFYVGRSAASITNSLIDFVNFGNNELSASPGGTITVPENPYRTGSLTPFAYLPVIQPNVGGNKQIWEGNLKKYSTDKGTLWGVNASGNPERLYVPPTRTSRGGGINDAAADIWTETPLAEGNDAIHNGGFYARLLAPDTSAIASTRKVLVETSATDSGLKEISVSDSGRPSGFGELTDSVFGDTAEAQRQSHRKLLNFLGFNIPTVADTVLDATDTESLDLTPYAPTEQNRTVGGVIHSAPVLASYSAEVEADGSISTDEDKRDEYVLFGSMDGALHMVDAASGEEKWAIIFKEMMRTQPDALVKNSAGSLKFGVDAPWIIRTEYNYKATTDESANTVTIFDPRDEDDNPNDELISTSNYIPMAAYGGFRLGAKGLYGLDLTSVDSPEVLFSITPDVESNSARLHAGGSTNTSEQYSNVGHIWSKPTIKRLRQTSGAEKAKDVLIFGGGYDVQYESPTYVPTNDAPALGSSLYIADAKTGEMIWSWDNPHNHSIVGGVTALDRDNDGLFDYLYFADLGGNVFRADFINGKELNFSNIRVTRILDASKDMIDSGADESLALRFYQRPIISFYRDEFSRLFAVVNIASGNRSSPLSKMRDNQEYANRVYGIFDREVITGDLIDDSSYSPLADLKESNLTNLNYEDLTDASESANLDRLSQLCNPVSGSDGFQIDSDGNYVYSSLCKQKVFLMSDMLDDDPTDLGRRTKSDGWYRTLTRFDGYENIKNVKAIGEGAVRASTFFLSVYESDIQFEAAQACSAEIKGATEVQQYCLPYGVCMDDSSISGNGGFISSGKGMQEMSFGAYDSENTAVTTLLGTKTLEESRTFSLSYNNDDDKGNYTVDNINDNGGRGDENGDGKAEDSNWKDGNALGADLEGSDGTSPVSLSNPRFILRPKRWYEINE